MKQTTAIPLTDAKIIAEVVELFFPESPDEKDYTEIKTHLLRIFGTDITTDHFIMLGQVIGIKALMTENKRKKINHNSYGSSHN